jgi:hypothetical protein
MKKVLSLLLITVTLLSCNSNEPNVVTVQPSQYTQTSQSEQTPAVGFDVQQFTNVLKTTTNPSSLEQAINNQGNTINNMDLNNDGNVDFLRIIETQGNVIQVVDNDVNPAVTVVTLNITQQGNQATFAYNGNPTYCGSSYNYHSSFTLGDYLFLSYLLRPHYSYYHPYYAYGYHPGYYRPYRRVSYRSYNRPYSSSSSRSTSTRTTTRTTVSKPTYTPSRTTVSSPTTSQRSFTPTTRNTGAPRSTGFGTSSPSSRPSSSFGSSRSSFGSSRSRGGRH